ncbi:response regulator [Rhizobacter sp. Root1221]|uniref:response regulator n=1 Tax=Rhizobacter sp. Root1221 TaxID=1736433 RepID=UPI000AA3B09C|nr:response regulator [Rhizobacter sp. Root1221]
MSALLFPGPVLLVGETKVRLRKLAGLLMDRGFDVVVAADAAPDRVRQLSGWCVVAVLDVGAKTRQALPAISRLHAARPLLPIVVLSREASRKLPVEVLRAGRDACVNALHDSQYLELEARLLGLRRRGVLGDWRS